MRCTGVLLVAGALLVLLGWQADASAELIDLELRAVSSPTGSDTATTLPASMANVATGSTFYLEAWMKDTGSPLWGVTGGYLDIAYTTNKVDATVLSHGSLYTNLASGTINDAAGLIDEFGGAWLPPHAGDPAPGKNDWALLGRITFTGIADGLVTFTPQESDDEFSRSSGGAASWSEINAPALTVTVGVPEPASALLLIGAALTIGTWRVSRRRRS